MLPAEKENWNYREGGMGSIEKRCETGICPRKSAHHCQACKRQPSMYTGERVAVTGVVEGRYAQEQGVTMAL